MAEHPHQTTNPEPKSEAKKVHPAVWVSSTYFAEGFPYAVVNNLADVLFVELGANLKTIGLTSLLHLPWNLKFLIAPVIDNFGSKRRWIIGLEVLLSIALLIFALSVTVQSIGLSLLALLFVALLSSIHDIAIDGYYLEILDTTEQTQWVGLRAPAYRIAMLLGGGGPALLLMTNTSWSFGLSVFTVFFAGLSLAHLFILPVSQQGTYRIRHLLNRSLLSYISIALLIVGSIYYLGIYKPIFILYRDLHTLAPSLIWFINTLGISGIIVICLCLTIFILLVTLPKTKNYLQKQNNIYAEAFVAFLERPGVAHTLWFVLFFRTGEAFLMKMRYPFLHSIGMDADAYGWAYGTWGLLAAMIAPALGGWLIAKNGLKQWLWPMVLAQNSLNITFWWLAWYSDFQIPSYTLITTIIVIESFGAGLGTAVFMVYLMRCSEEKHQAAHFALLTALMGTSFTVAGTTSGILAELLGFTYYFAFATIATIPGMLVIPWLRELKEI